MNLTLNNQKIYVNEANEKILLSAQINGGKNLDGTYKPSGFLKVRPVQNAADNFSDQIGDIRDEHNDTLPKYIIVNGKGFIAYEEWDGKDGKHKDFVAVLTYAKIVGDSFQAEENQKKPLNF